MKVLPKEQKTHPAKRIAKLLDFFDIEVLDGYSAKIKKDPYIPLSIEIHDDLIYLAHYISQNGDTFHDGEMVFQVLPLGYLWLKETAVRDPFRGGELRGCDHSFANIFTKNIIDQFCNKEAVLEVRSQSSEKIPPVDKKEEIDILRDYLYRSEDEPEGSPKKRCLDSYQAIQKLKQDPKNAWELASLFTGGGPLKEAGIFDSNPKSVWARNLQEQIQKLLTEEEWISLKNTGMLNAHYTRPDVIQECWRFADNYFKSIDQQEITVLDPGCGVLGFLSNFDEENSGIRINKYVGVEIDPITAQLAKAIAGDGVQVFERDFLDFQYPEKFNLVIGNIPFEDGRKRDSTTKLNVGLHAQIFMKLINHCHKNGNGLVVLLTSTNTLDSRGDSYVQFRKMISTHFCFLGAIRLPAKSAHQSQTEVTTDIIVLRKSQYPSLSKDQGFVETYPSEIVTSDGEPTYINRWFLLHPEMMLGEPCLEKCYPGKKFGLKMNRDQSEFIERLRSAFDRILTGELSGQQTVNQQQKQEEKIMSVVADYRQFKASLLDGSIVVHFPAEPPAKVQSFLQAHQFAPQFVPDGDLDWIASFNPKTEAAIKALSEKCAGSVVDLPAPQPPTPSSGGIAGLFGNLMQSMQEMRQEIAELKSVMTVSQDVAKLIEEKAILEKEIAELHSDRSNLKQEIKELKVERQKVADQVADKERRNKELTTEMYEVKESLKQLNQSLGNQQAIAAELAELKEIKQAFGMPVEAPKIEIEIDLSDLDDLDDLDGELDSVQSVPIDTVVKEIDYRDHGSNGNGNGNGKSPKK